MFEFLKMLLETFKDSISLDRILEAKKKKDVNVVGTELFLLYQKLNDIVVVGRWIIADIDNSIDWLEKKQEAGELSATRHTRLAKLLDYQRAQLMDFTRILMNMRYSLNIISPDEYSRLVPLLEGKGKYIVWLLTLIHREKNYLDIKPLPFIEFLDSCDGKPAHVLATPPREEILDDAFDGLVPDIERVTADQLPALRSYREHRNGEQVLQEIEELASQLRKNIIENFDAKDILVSLGDTRSVKDALN